MRLGFSESFRFAPFQLGLAMFSSFGGIGSSPEHRFFDEVAPAFEAVGGVLGILEHLQLRFRVVFAPDYSDYSSGAVGADVMPDDGVRSGGVVARHKESLLGSLGKNRAAGCRAQSSCPVSAMISASRAACRFAIKLGTSLVHSHGTPVEGISIESGNRGLSFSRQLHLDKSDTARLTRVPVQDDGDAFDGAVEQKISSSCCFVTVMSRFPTKTLVTSPIRPLTFTNVRRGTRSGVFKRRSVRDRLSQDVRLYRGCTFSACQPLGPLVTSNCTV